MRSRTIFLVGVPLILAAAPFGYSLTQTASLPQLASAKPGDTRKSAEKLCASRIVNDRLKAQLFNEAAAVGGGASSNLDLLASFSEVRMEQPVVKDQDGDLGVTVCEGRFVVLLPPGSERGFGGMRVLRANVQYAAQQAADGSGLVYQLKGAESIVYRIAAFSLRNHTIVPRGTQMAKAEPLSEMPLAVAPAVWPEPPKAEAPSPESVAPPPVAPVQVAEVEKPAPAKPAPPVKVVKAEPEAKKEPVKRAAKVVTPPKEPEVKAKPVQLASVVKEEPAVAAKPKPNQAAPAKPKERKPVRLAEAPKQAAKKPAQKATPARVEKAPVQLAQKKPPVEAKPKVQLAAAVPRKAAEPPRDLTSNSFLAYEQARQRKPEPAGQPVVQRASAPAPRDDCGSAGGIEARLVCANPGLASKQRAANNFYYASLEQASQAARRELTGSRSRFLAYLDRCRSAACASAAYDDRMAEIRDIMREF